MSEQSVLNPSIIRNQLARVVGSRTFCRAGFLRRFLEVCVSETLLGNSGSLKEIWLGGSVFGRHGDFNPGVDPIVRVQARRVREKLAQYYNTEGAKDDVRIALPVGSYVPVFSTAMHDTCIPSLRKRPIAVTVLPLRSMEQTQASQQISLAVTSELSCALPERGALTVVSGELDADFVIAGTVRSGSASHRISLELTDRHKGLHCWSAWFEQRNTRYFLDLQTVARMLREELFEGREATTVAVHQAAPEGKTYSMSANPRFM